MDEEYDVWGVACSTKGSATLVIVNGPVRSEIAINCGTNVFGPGFRANATIGRAVRLMILNLGGARPNELDKGTLGHPGRFRSEEHTSELQSLMRISYAVFCLKKKTITHNIHTITKVH